MTTHFRTRSGNKKRYLNIAWVSGGSVPADCMSAQRVFCACGPSCPVVVPQYPTALSGRDFIGLRDQILKISQKGDERRCGLAECAPS
eukprot:356497-Chlamydomonas_euryale.AAC.3